MSATRAGGDDAPARTPVLVVTSGELEHRVRDILGSAATLDEGYSESYGYKKTDLNYPGTGAITGNHQVLSGDVRAIGGWAIRETTGAAGAVVRLHDGSAAIGEVIAPIGLVASGFAFFQPIGKGIEVATGRVFLEVVSGSVEGVIYWR